MSWFRNLSAVCLLSAGIVGCAYPVSSVDQGAASSGLYFSPAFAGAHVWIDGADAGAASAFDGKKAILTVPAGRHQVTIKGDGAPLYDKPLYVGAGARIEIKGN
jgi:hypothetical protein